MQLTHIWVSLVLIRWTWALLAHPLLENFRGNMTCWGSLDSPPWSLQMTPGDCFFNILTSYILFRNDSSVFQMRRFSIMAWQRILTGSLCSVPHSRAFFIRYGLHLPTPASQSVPPHPPSPLATTGLFSVSVSLSVPQIGSFLSYFRFHICMIPYGICLST